MSLSDPRTHPHHPPPTAHLIPPTARTRPYPLHLLLSGPTSISPPSPTIDHAPTQPVDPNRFTNFERLFLAGPIITSLLTHIQTPTLLSLTATSKRLRYLIHGALSADPSLCAEFVFVRNEKWPLLVRPFIKRILEAGPPPTISSELMDGDTHSYFFSRYVQFAEYYTAIAQVEKKLEWEEQVNWMVEKMAGLPLPGVETLQLVSESRAGVLTRAESCGLTTSELQDRMEVGLKKHRFVRGDLRGGYAGVYIDEDGETKRAPPHDWCFYETFTGVQLFLALKRLPVPARDITKLVIDGTAVREEELYPVLKSLERSLETVSARRCRNLGAGVWCDWIEGCVKEERPFALTYLKVYGSKGMSRPYESSFTKIPPDLFLAAGLPRESPIPYFAEIIPYEILQSLTLPTLIPQHFDYPTRARAFMLLCMQLANDYADWGALASDIKAQGYKVPAFEGGMVLAEIPAQIRLITLGNWLPLHLDLAHCASGRYCWTYTSRKYIQQKRDPNAHPQFDVELGNMAVPVTKEEAGEIMERWNSVFPHVPVGKGERREMGGRPCRCCGIWETRNAEVVDGFAYKQNPMDHLPGWVPVDVQEVLMKGGGIEWDQAVIGQGRFRGKGEYCPECILNQTCRVCEDFYCTNCLYPPSTYASSPNPHCTTPPTPTFLVHNCSRHSPICHTCAPSSFVTCTFCTRTICTQCHPSGFTLTPHPVSLASVLSAHQTDPSPSAYRGDGFCIPKEVLPPPSTMPAHEAIRTDAALRGLHESLAYATCHICLTTGCSACLSKHSPRGAVGFTTPCGDCLQEMCEPCVFFRCDMCDRTLCPECTEKEVETVINVRVALEGEGGGIPEVPEGEEEVGVELCLHCLLYRRYRVLEHEGVLPPSASFFAEEKEARRRFIGDWARKMQEEGGVRVDESSGEVVEGGEEELEVLGRVQEIVDAAVERREREVRALGKEEVMEALAVLAGLRVDDDEMETDSDEDL